MITLATLKDATRQQVFDQVVENSLRQSEKCMERASCKYLHGTYKCAAGWLIGPEEYKKSLEGNDWESLVNAELVPNFHSSLICALQEVHDTADVKRWQDGFYDVATEFDLDSTVIDNFSWDCGKECYSFNG
jgi:hypothetical protein